MNGIVEIILLIACCGVLGAAAVYLIREEMLVRRYKKFYETTEEGRRLYRVQYQLDHLGRKHDFIKNRMSELRDKINEYATYMPDENENREILQELKLQYHYNNEELKWTKEAMVDREKLIDEIVAELPKKYKGILEYNWELAKVEVKEKDICW